MLNKLYFELLPQIEVQGREVWRARRLKLNCAVQHCPVVLTSRLLACDGAMSKSNKNLRPGSMRSVQLVAMYSSITLIHSSLLILVQRRRNVKSAHDARDHRSSRGRRL